MGYRKDTTVGTFFSYNTMVEEPSAPPPASQNLIGQTNVTVVYKTPYPLPWHAFTHEQTKERKPWVGLSGGGASRD